MLLNLTKINRFDYTKYIAQKIKTMVIFYHVVCKIVKEHIDNK